ncbi:VF530 family DNA-binding protein [Reinekea marinisedimentorum]|uniref:Uncharacterized protein (DUF2132 family) n=1 Tax=Reinekea marinisedimentorum TaxID=230495 RepID=A0A4V2UJQ1_9GAMM|nr:VF530 family DNA-binding protein [Reinekea marinisedimentorum]TCS41036.1 uncharacterized protein (DUF2132 family) [Reinekea marinisedimentorum]
MTEQYENNPLHGLKLETLITELVDFYGYEILGEALNFKCFQLNPSIKGSMKFLKKTEWAREKIEAFYLYKFKNLPRPDNTQYALPPRDRIIPEHQKPREPVTFTLEELKEANERKRKQAADRPHNKPAHRRGNDRPSHSANTRERPARKPARESSSSEDSFDPWAQARKNLQDKKEH